MIFNIYKSDGSKMIKIGYFLIGDSRINNNYNNTEFLINS